MPAVLIETSVSLDVIRDNLIGCFFLDIENYKPDVTGNQEEIILPNGVKLLGIEVHPQSSDNLVNHVKVYYDDSSLETPWRPEIGRIGARTISTVGIHVKKEPVGYKYAVMVFDSPAPVESGDTSFLLA